MLDEQAKKLLERLPGGVDVTIAFQTLEGFVGSGYRAGLERNLNLIPPLNELDEKFQGPTVQAFNRRFGFWLHTLMNIHEVPCFKAMHLLTMVEPMEGFREILREVCRDRWGSDNLGKELEKRSDIFEPALIEAVHGIMTVTFQNRIEKWLSEC